MSNQDTARKPAEPATEVTALQAKRTLADLLSRVGFGGERFVITRHGKKVAAIVGVQDLEALDGAA